MLHIPKPPTPKTSKAMRGGGDTDGKKKVLQAVYYTDDADAMLVWQNACTDAKARGLRSANAFAQYAIALVAEHTAANELANTIDAMEWLANTDTAKLIADAEDAIAQSADDDYTDELRTFIDEVRNAERAARTQALDGIERVQNAIAEWCDELGVGIDGAPLGDRDSAAAVRAAGVDARADIFDDGAKA